MFSIINCKAQNFPLITFPDDIPINSHIKDLDNEYDSYIGSWNVSTGGKTITLKITKVLDKPRTSVDRPYFSDVLIVQHKIVDASGNIVEDFISPNIDDFKIISTLYSKNQQLVRLAYSGTQCGVGSGFISIKLINPNQFEWTYNPNATKLTPKSCPNYPLGGISINLPYEPKNLVFTKQ